MEKEKIKETGDVITKFDFVKANKARDLIQQNAVNMFQKNNNILLTWATGCGKTLAALKMILTLKHPTGYIICKENSHMSNWMADMDKHGLKGSVMTIGSINMFLYASLHKYTDTGVVDFIILDECHALTEKRFEHLNNIIGPNTAIIMLSATVNPDKKELLRALCPKPYVESHISISDAIENGLLPSPKVFIHYYGLDNTKRNLTFVFEQGSKDKRVVNKCKYGEHAAYMRKHFHLELHVKCTEQEQYQLITAEIEKYRKKFFMNRDIWAKNKWVNLGSQRKRMMAGMKTKHAKKLINSDFKGSRFICFTGSKKQCEEIGGKKFVHSDMKSKDVIDKKDMFNEGKIDELYVVNMFREGINLVNVEKGLIVQLDNVKLTFIQMLGRVFRSQLPEMHIMVLKNTQDEKYYRNVMRGFNMDYVTIKNHTI